MPYDNLDAKINAITQAKLDELTANAVRIFKEEIPRKSGDLRKSVRSTPAKRRSDGSFVSEIIIDSDYARAVDLGIDESAGQVQTAKGKYMVFDDWPGGPDELRWKDGKFRFYRVRHVSRADHYSERALKRIRALGKTSLFAKIKLSIKSLLGIK